MDKDIPEILGRDFVQSVRKTKEPKESESSRKGSKSTVPTEAADQVEISPESRKAKSEADKIKAWTNMLLESDKLPAPSGDRVARVKAKLDSGYMNDPEVIRKMTDALMDDLLNLD